MEQKTHPIILTYKDTLSHQAPLILFILREPNTSETLCTDTVGPYSFEDFPRCAAWNAAYNIVGTYCGRNTAQLKEHCKKDLKASPIVFTDALSRGIPHIPPGEGNKRAIRKQYIDVKHADRIFERTEVINQVKLILLSGLQDSLYKGFNERIKSHADERHIPIDRTLFPYGTNLKKIHRQLSESTKNIIVEIGAQWLNVKAPFVS